MDRVTLFLAALTVLSLSSLATLVFMAYTAQTYIPVEVRFQRVRVAGDISLLYTGRKTIAFTAGGRTIYLYPNTVIRLVLQPSLYRRGSSVKFLLDCGSGRLVVQGVKCLKVIVGPVVAAAGLPVGNLQLEGLVSGVYFEASFDPHTILAINAPGVRVERPGLAEAKVLVEGCGPGGVIDLDVLHGRLLAPASKLIVNGVVYESKWVLVRSWVPLLTVLAIVPAAILALNIFTARRPPV